MSDPELKAARMLQSSFRRWVRRLRALDAKMAEFSERGRYEEHRTFESWEAGTLRVKSAPEGQPERRAIARRTVAAPQKAAGRHPRGGAARVVVPLVDAATGEEIELDAEPWGDAAAHDDDDDDSLASRKEEEEAAEGVPEEPSADDDALPRLPLPWAVPIDDDDARPRRRLSKIVAPPCRRLAMWFCVSVVSPPWEVLFREHAKSATRLFSLSLRVRRSKSRAAARLRRPRVRSSGNAPAAKLGI